MGYKVAVIGATGIVGHEIIATLAERNFPVDELIPLASRRSSGRPISFGDKDITVKALEDFDFKGVDIVLSSAGGHISEQFVPVATKAGAVVIDNTSHYRNDPDVPLIIPEINGDMIGDYKKKNIIANPNCSTIQMLMALKPLHDHAKVKRVVASTYQSVSGAGKDAMDELFNQCRKFFVNDVLERQVFTKQIAFNVLPQIDSFMDGGATKEEWKMAVETKKILGKDVKVTATCVRVPVFIGHGVAVNVEFENEIPPLEARRLWRDFEGVTVIDVESEMEYVTPIDIAGEDDVYISRVRADSTVDNGLSFWCVADNIRKGAALNAVQIAEKLITLL